MADPRDGSYEDFTRENGEVFEEKSAEVFPRLVNVDNYDPGEMSVDAHFDDED